MTTKSSFILEHTHVKAIFGRKKYSQNRSPKWRFFGNLIVNINCGHRDPQKAHAWRERRLLAYFS